MSTPEGPPLTATPASEPGSVASERRQTSAALTGGLTAFGLAFVAVVASLCAAIVADRQFGPTAQKACALFAVFIGLSQILYVLPIYVWARRRGSAQFCVGFLSGAAVILAFNVLFAVLVAVYAPVSD